jgi:hypothetical protein
LGSVKCRALVTVQRDDPQTTAFETQKGPGWRRGLLQFCCVAWRAAWDIRLFGRDSHRKSGVFSLRLLLSPVD